MLNIPTLKAAARVPLGSTARASPQVEYLSSRNGSLRGAASTGVRAGPGVVVGLHGACRWGSHLEVELELSPRRPAKKDRVCNTGSMGEKES